MSCLYGPPAMTVPTGQLVVWAYATSFTYVPGSFPGHITGSADVSCGGITVLTGVPGSLGGECLWTGFSIPTLPDGSTINDMKAVAIATDQQAFGSSSSMFGPFGWSQPSPKPYSHVLKIGSSMGSDPNHIGGPGGQTLAQQQFRIDAGASVPGTYNRFTGFDFAAVAVFYTPPPRKLIQTWVTIGNTRTNR